MKSLTLTKGREQWRVSYDEEAQSVTVEGPSPTGAEIYCWLTSAKRVVDESGAMILAKPVQSWGYLVQAVEVDMYADLGLAPLQGADHGE